MTVINEQLGKPIPVRLKESNQEKLDQLSKETGLSRSELIRRACAWALPKFISGEIPVVQTTEGGVV